MAVKSTATPEPSLRHSKDFPGFPLAELHAHLATSLTPIVLWQIAHANGIKLQQRDFRAFQEYVMLSPERRMSLNDYFNRIYHPILDRISSGTHAVQQATYETMGGAYREGGISLIELRCNPMKHNLDAQLDLDHIIMAMIHGMEQALLEHAQLSAGLIFCIGRDLSYQQNEIIIQKAIRYHRRGVVGVDVAGPANPQFHLKDYAALFARARKAGLGITIHSGEVAEATDIWEALEHIQPSRIGHGIRAAYDKPLLAELARRKVVLEVCPMSNIATKAVSGMDEIKLILRTLQEHNVRFCINTDWPAVIRGCHLRPQLEMLRDSQALTESEIIQANRTAFAASFIPKPGGLDAYL